MKERKVLMCCSNLSVKGGMVSVVKNYLAYRHWDEFDITYIPTHVERNKILVSFYFVMAYIRILITISSGNIDIAHLHTAERGSFFRKAILARTLKKFGIKVIMHHHAAEFETFYNSLSEKKKQFACKTLEMVDLNLVLSENLIPMISEKAHNAKIEVLYNAVKTYPQNPYNNGANGILFLGRLGERKGVYDLLEAIKRIDSALNNDIKLYLCGDGDISGVEKKVKELGLEDRVEHIGWITDTEKVSYFSKTCINVLPSYNEGLPMSLLETMAYGIPSISTNIASIPEIIDSETNGFLIEPGDIESLSNNILKLLEDKELRTRFSNNSYNLVSDKFGLDNHLSRLKNLYRETLEES